MARCGVGNFILIDPDICEARNVLTQRSYIADSGQAKVKALANKILNVNPKAKVDIHWMAITKDTTIEEFVEMLPEDTFKDPSKVLIVASTDDFSAQDAILKVLHSNSKKHRKVVWYCNHRYDGDEKCASPSISESDIKKYYLEALEKLLSNKDSYITECQERLENEDVLVQLKETRQQAEISLEDLMAEIQGLVHENARKSQDQQKYRAKFNKFVQQIDEQKKRMAVLKAEELKLVGMREKLHRFIETLKNCKDATVFKEQEWNNLVERAVVKTESLDFEFKNGERIKITI